MIHNETLNDISETDDIYVVVSLARSSLHFLVFEGLKKRVSEFEAVQKVFKPNFIKMAEMALEAHLITAEQFDGLKLIEEIFQDRNTKSYDLKKIIPYQWLDEEEQRKHKNFMDQDYKTHLKAGIMFFLQEIDEVIKRGSEEIEDEW